MGFFNNMFSYCLPDLSQIHSLPLLRIMVNIYIYIYFFAELFLFVCLFVLLGYGRHSDCNISRIEKEKLTQFISTTMRFRAKMTNAGHVMTLGSEYFILTCYKFNS